MDFTFTEEQEAVRDLAAQILGDQLPPERLRQLETAGQWFAEDTWRALGTAGLLGLAVPEADGGSGLGVVEACVVAEQLGRRVAPVPYLACVVGAGLPIARFGTDDQRRQLLPPLLAGEELVVAAFHEPVDPELPAVPATTATPADGGWRIEGRKAVVTMADRATALLVPARTGDGTSAVFVVDPSAPGVSLDVATAVTGEPQHVVDLDGVAVGERDVLGGPGRGAEVVAWTVDRMLAATCAMQTGVCEEAVAITAAYVSEREQFGAKLGTFQAVGHRVADAYIDTEAIRLTALQAAWRLDAGLEATDELMVAKFWAAEGAQRVVHAAQHLHGGIGVDLDYPIHRYFRWAKVLELLLGGATPSLRRLGSRLAARTFPVPSSTP